MRIAAQIGKCRCTVLATGLIAAAWVVLCITLPQMGAGANDVLPVAARKPATSTAYRLESSLAVASEMKPVDDRPAVKPVSEQQAALDEGKALFRGLCSGCHGGAGRGGKGPNLTDDRWLHGDKDADIARVIRNGVPRTTMKKLGEALKDEQLKKVIAYVRSLARVGGDSNWKPYLPGDPKAGEQLFFDPKGKAQCSKCHTVARKGGRIGPALDRIAARRSAEYIMESILESSKFIDPRYEMMQVITSKGKVIIGLRVNENNFSIQLREENGRFHSLFKRDLEEYSVQKKSIMPDNYDQILTVKQLHDLFAFLMKLE